MIVKNDAGERWTLEAQTPLEASFLKSLVLGLGYAYPPDRPLHPITPPFEGENGRITELTTADVLAATATTSDGSTMRPAPG